MQVSNTQLEVSHLQERRVDIYRPSCSSHLLQATIGRPILHTGSMAALQLTAASWCPPEQIVLLFQQIHIVDSFSPVRIWLDLNSDSPSGLSRPIKRIPTIGKYQQAKRFVVLMRLSCLQYRHFGNKRLFNTTLLPNHQWIAQGQLKVSPYLLGFDAADVVKPGLNPDARIMNRQIKLEPLFP